MPQPRFLFKALKYTILTFASLHLIISYTLMLTANYEEGNLFRIIAINKLFPSLDSGWMNFIFSQVIAISVYLSYLLYINYRNRRHTQEGKQLN